MKLAPRYLAVKELQPEILDSCSKTPNKSAPIARGRSFELDLENSPYFFFGAAFFLAGAFFFVAFFID